MYTFNKIMHNKIAMSANRYELGGGVKALEDASVKKSFFESALLVKYLISQE